MLNLRYVDLVVLSMSSEELDEDDLRGVVNRYDEPVGISFNIENDPFIANNARAQITLKT
jgi:hypothetical protein